MPTTSQLLTVGTITVVLGFVGYAVYFDYTRRNDPQLRKRLRKEKKRVDRSNASASTEKGYPTPAELDAALEVIRSEEIPATAEEKEAYFMQNLAVGEQLASQGVTLPAALAFFRAMRVYPEPLQLVAILQKTLPETTFKIVMELMSRDVSGPTTTASETSQSSAKGKRPKRKTRTGTSSRGPPSEASSQEWDKVTEPDASVASSVASLPA